MISRVAQGSTAENLACQYLETRGLVLVARNVRYRGGELDLIMREGETLVFVEVRSRRQSSYGTPAETVTPIKQQRLIHAASLYLQRQALDLPCRFDVVAILQDGSAPRIDWIRDAFQLN